MRASDTDVCKSHAVPTLFHYYHYTLSNAALCQEEEEEGERKRGGKRREGREEEKKKLKEGEGGGRILKKSFVSISNGANDLIHVCACKSFNRICTSDVHIQ